MFYYEYQWPLLLFIYYSLYGGLFCVFIEENDTEYTEKPAITGGF